MTTTDAKFFQLLNLIKTFENENEINKFIVDNTLDPDSEDFYNNATDNVQVMVNSLVHIANVLLFAKDLSINAEVQSKLNELGYTIKIIESPGNTDPACILTTSRCDIII